MANRAGQLWGSTFLSAGLIAFFAVLVAHGEFDVPFHGWYETCLGASAVVAVLGILLLLSSR